MFGVDSSGEDTLSFQFRKTKGTEVNIPGMLKKAGELERTSSKLIDWLRKCGVAESRRKILESLKRNGLLDVSADITALVEEELVARAQRLAEQGMEEMRRMASSAAILRTSL